MNKMGKSNSKPLTGTEESEKSQPVRLLGKRLCDRASCKNRKPKLKGCAKIMCEKHGDETCKQLPFWVDTFGFPENGSFSVRLIQRLQEELEDYEKKGYGSVDWKPFKKWKEETEERQKQQEKGRKKAPGKTNLCPQPSHPQKDLNLLPASAAHQPANPQREVRGQPSPAERTPLGPRSAPPPHHESATASPSAEDVLVSPVSGRRKSQTTPATNKIIEVPNLRETGAREIDHYEASTLDSEATRSLTTNGIEIIEERDLREIGAGVMDLYRARTQDSGTRRSQTTPAYHIDGPNPRDIGAGAMDVYGATRTQKTHSIIQIVQVPYAYEVWTPDELRLIANELPDIAKRGGAAFVEILSQIVQQFKPSLREILSLVIHNLKLKFGKVQGDWPERLRDARYDWTPGAGYREHVEELCERIKTTFPAIVRWKAIDCRQKPGEMVEDYLIRLTKDFDENSGLDSDKPMYGFLLMNYFLLGLDKQIKDQARKHSQFWEIGPLSSIRAHAVRAEETLRDLDDKKKQATARLEERLMKACIQALQAANGRRNGGRGPSGGSRRHGCWICGDPSHWKRDCNQSG